MINLAVHYSPQLVTLLQNDEVKIDYFKCPAWLDIIPQACNVSPTYVHFPLTIGSQLINTETKQAPDWHQIERILSISDTHFINAHLGANADEFPHLPANTEQPHHIEQVVETTLQHVQTLTQRFGAERVMLENLYDTHRGRLRLIILAEVISQIVQESGCGFLFDISHARMAAEVLGIDSKEYIANLPIQKTQEIHWTGIQAINDYWLNKIENAGIDTTPMQPFRGQKQDHLPMTDDDWVFFTWALSQLKQGLWGNPWVIAFEYGGVGEGSLWQALTDIDILRDQVPRLYAMCHDN